MKFVRIALPVLVAVFLFVCWLLMSHQGAEINAPSPKQVIEQPESAEVRPLRIVEDDSLPIVPEPPEAVPEVVKEAEPEPANEATTSEATEAPASDFKGDVLLARKGPRANSPTYAMIGNLSGEVPARGTLIDICDEDGGLICRAKVVQYFHFNGDESEPVNEIGVQTIDETSQNPVRTGDRATGQSS